MTWFTRKVGAFAGIGLEQDWKCIEVLPGQLFEFISCIQLTWDKEIVESNFMFRYLLSFSCSEISVLIHQAEFWQLLVIVQLEKCSWTEKSQEREAFGQELMGGYLPLKDLSFSIRLC